MEKQFVSFDVAGNKYCLNIMDVNEVYREKKFTRMPDMPPFVEGIMNLRGIVIPVISVKKKLGLMALDEQDSGLQKTDENAEVQKADMTTKARLKQQTMSLKLIIVKVEAVLVGFLVDKLDRVFSIDDTQIQSSEGVSGSIDRDMVEGVIKMEENAYIVLDVKRMIGFEEKKFFSSEIIE